MLALHPRVAADVESQILAAGGAATVVRTPEQWAEHPQAQIMAELPVVELTALGDTQPAQLIETTVDAPLAGVRVLDLTRVIAGPVAGRTLELWGADVLRIGSPRHPEIGWQHLNTGAGKRSTLLDLDDDTDRATFEKLLETANVVLTAYRPGSLDKFNLSPAALHYDGGPAGFLASAVAWGSSEARWLS